jgi:hypothetical protein
MLLYASLIAGFMTQIFANEIWQIPLVNLNIKPLGYDVGAKVSSVDLWMSY